MNVSGDDDDDDKDDDDGDDNNDDGVNERKNCHSSNEDGDDMIEMKFVQ